MSISLNGDHDNPIYQRYQALDTRLQRNNPTLSRQRYMSKQEVSFPLVQVNLLCHVANIFGLLLFYRSLYFLEI